ncbi:MAG: methionyl-tRNA formyltransferase [Desulfobacteraceae bacterium]|nr:methionyl-tRNA formyltransferase [Desulfobacteraceae bacterium]
MKVVFIGTVDSSIVILEKLIALNADIVGVVTKSHSNFNTDYADLTPVCDKNKILYNIVEDVNSRESINWISSRKPDIIFCFGWSSLIKKKLLDLPPMGIIGYHPAELPANRGRHPLIWALFLGLKRSASTFFFMDEGADDGDILSQVKFEISYNDDAASLYHKVTELALKQIEDFLPELKKGTYKKEPQPLLSNVWRKRGIKDGVIDFRMNSYAIYNLVRALTKPYIGAHLDFDKKSIKIWKVEEVNFEQPNIEPGKVLDVDNNNILVKCYDGAIRILEHEFDILPKVGDYL